MNLFRFGSVLKDVSGGGLSEINLWLWFAPFEAVEKALTLSDVLLLRTFKGILSDFI